jgi:hypothetical protein
VAEKLGERFEQSRELQGKSVCIYAIERADWLARQPMDSTLPEG